MHDHDAKEDRIEPRERGIEPGDEAPAKRKVEIGGIVDLARVLEPAIAEQ